jgi:adhesin HecA-like repeat protein
MAPGSILEAQTDRLIDIRADNIHLTAGDTIGQPGTNRSLDVAVDAHGVVDADAPNGIYLNSTGGSGKLGNIHTGGRFDFSVDQGSMDIAGTISADVGVSLAASDNLNFSGGLVRSNGEVSLQAGTDGTGGVNAPKVMAGGNVEIVAADAINVADGQVNAGGSIALRAGTNIVFGGGQVHAVGDVLLQAGSAGIGSVAGSSQSGPDVVAEGEVTITAVNDIGGQRPLQIQTAQQATLRASNINAELSPVVAGNPLSVTVTGPIGDTTLNANLNFVDVGDVTLPSFIVHNGVVHTDGPTLSVQQGYLGDAVTFFTPYFSARIDHLVRSKTPGLDVRAFTLNNDFSLSLTPASANLNDLIINQNLRRSVFGSSRGVADVLTAESLQTLQRQLPGQGFAPPPSAPPADGEPLVILDQISLADGLIPKQ